MRCSPSALAFLVPGFHAFSAFFSSTCGPDMEGRLIRMVGGPPGPPGGPPGPPGPPRSRPGCFWSDRFLVTLPWKKTMANKRNGLHFLFYLWPHWNLKQDFGPDKRKSSQSVDEKLRITVISGWHLKRAIGLFLFLQFRSENDILLCKRFNAGAS